MYVFIITQIVSRSFFLSLFLLQYWYLNSEPSPWATPGALFLYRVFRDRVSGTICLGWLWTAVLLFSASWVARITGVRHQCLSLYFFVLMFLWSPCFPLLIFFVKFLSQFHWFHL
jgi:hypothetical protein